MRRTFFSLTAGAIALLVSANAGAATTTPESTVAVESAGKDGGEPFRVVQVESADYDGVPAPPDGVKSTAMPLPMIAVVGSLFLAGGSVLWLRRRR